MKTAHSEKFGGDTITGLKYGPDWQIKINDRAFGNYTLLESGVKAARDEIIRRIEGK